MRVWIYPTLIFVLFLYVMAFIIIYTYKIDVKQSYTSVTSSGTTDLKSLKLEVMKQLK